MYLTDFREYCLKDVIMQLEPELFRKVTGLTLKDFSLLVSLGVFNSDLMNDAVYKFKRYEDASLEYTGINTHTNTVIGGWDTVIEKTAIEDKEIEEDIIEEEEKKETLIDENPWEHLQVGQIVIHKSFGQGEVVSLDDRYIIVRFPEYEKKFQFPEAFIREYLSC